MEGFLKWTDACKKIRERKNYEKINKDKTKLQKFADFFFFFQSCFLKNIGFFLI